LSAEIIIYIIITSTYNIDLLLLIQYFQLIARSQTSLWSGKFLGFTAMVVPLQLLKKSALVQQTKAQNETDYYTLYFL